MLGELPAGANLKSSFHPSLSPRPPSSPYPVSYPVPREGQGARIHIYGILADLSGNLRPLSPSPLRARRTRRRYHFRRDCSRRSRFGPERRRRAYLASIPCDYFVIRVRNVPVGEGARYPRDNSQIPAAFSPREDERAERRRGE